MIVSFKHKGLKRLFERGDRSHIGADLINKVENILATLDAAGTPQALDLPGYRLHPLKGSRKGFWAVTCPGKQTNKGWANTSRRGGTVRA